MRNNTNTRKDTEDKKDLYLEHLVQQVLRKYNKEEAETETCEAANTSKSLEREASSTSPSLPRAPKPILKKQNKDEQSHPKCSSSSSSSSSMPHHWQEIVLSFKSSSTPSLRSSPKNNKIMLPVVKALYRNPTWFDQILREYAPAFATARTPRVQAAVLQQILSSVAQHGATLLVPHAWTQQDLLRHLTRLLRIQWANQTWSTMAAAQDVVLPANNDDNDKHRSKSKEANPAFWNRRIQQHVPRYAAATTPQEQEAIVQQVLNVFRGEDSSCCRLVVPPGWNEKDIAHHVHDILRQESSHQQTSTATVKDESSSSSTKTTATLPPRQVSPCPVDKASFKRKATSQDVVVTPPLPQPCYSYYPPPAPYSAATRCAAVELEPPAVPCFSSQPPVRLTPRCPTTITTTTCRGPYSDLMRKNAVQQPKKKRKTQNVVQPTTTVPATTQPVVVPFCRPHPYYCPTTPTSTITTTTTTAAPCYSHSAPGAATSTTGSAVPTHPDACTSK